MSSWNSEVSKYGGIDALSDRFDQLKLEYPRGAQVTDAEYTMVWIKYPEMSAMTFRIWAACRDMFLEQLRNDSDESVRKIAATASDERQ
jgi:hypothetical protein